MNKGICIYHGNCADGFGAAWSVHNARGNTLEYYAGVHQTPPPNVTGKEVIIVDFSYKRPIIEEMAKVAKSILILDHHKTAQEDLEPLLANGTIHGEFNLNKSGAMLAWEHFNTTSTAPELIRHIQDRDLWQFKLAGTREISASIFSYPYDFEVWSKLMESSLEELRLEGIALERKHFKDIEELLLVAKRQMIIGGYLIWVANLPYTLSSDAANMLCKVTHPGAFGACYMDTADGRVFSLRSIGKFDVSEIAKQYGGGGHRNAAGFRKEIGWEGEH